MPLLLANKKGGRNRCYAITAGPLATRLESLALLGGAEFAEPWWLLAIAPGTRGG